MLGKSQKMDSVLADVEKANREQEKSASQAITDLTSLSALLKDMDPDAIKKLLDADSMKEFTSSIASADDNLASMIQNFDKLSKANRDILALQKVSGQSYEDASKSVKKLYEATVESLKVKKDSLALDKEALADAGSATAKEVKAINEQIGALNKLIKIQDQAVSQRDKAHKDYLAQLEKEKKENLSLGNLLKEKFGKQVGSEGLGALMGGKVGGSFTNLILGKIGQIGGDKGIGAALGNSELAKIFAKGFDISDSNKKILDNSGRGLEYDKKQLEEEKQTRSSLGTNVALAAVGGAMLGHYGIKKGIEGAGDAVKTVESFRQAGGYEKALYGQVGGAITGKIFGDKAGAAITGMIGSFVDALTYEKKKGMDSAIFSQIMKQQGGSAVSFMGADKGGRITSQELQEVGNRYSGHGRAMKGINDYVTMQSFDRTYGSDVMDAGFQAIGKGLITSDTIAARVAQTFRSIQKTVQDTGGSVKEVTKQLFSAAEASRFLNVDIKGVAGLYKSLFKPGNKGDLMAVGVDVKNPGAALSRIMSIGSKDPALGMLLQGADREKYGSGLKSFSGAFWRLKSDDLGLIKQTKDGWSIDQDNEDVIKARNSVKKGNQSEAAWRAKQDDAVSELVKKKSNQYAYNQVSEAVTLARKAGPETAVQAKVLEQLLGVSAEDAKLLLKANGLDTKEGNRILKELNEGAKSEKDYLKELASSATVSAKAEANTMGLLIDILAFLVALPPYLSELFVPGKNDAKNVMAMIGTSIGQHIDGVKGSYNNSHVNKALALEFYTGSEADRKAKAAQDAEARIWADPSLRAGQRAKLLFAARDGSFDIGKEELEAYLKSPSSENTAQPKQKSKFFTDTISNANKQILEEVNKSKKQSKQKITPGNQSNNSSFSNAPWLSGSLDSVNQAMTTAMNTATTNAKSSKGTTTHSTSDGGITINFNGTVLAEGTTLEGWIITAVRKAKKQGLV